MAVLDWKKLVTIVERRSKPTTVKLEPKHKVAESMDTALDNFKRGNINKKGEPIKRATIEADGDDKVVFTVRYANVPIKLLEDGTDLSVAKAKFESVYTLVREAFLDGDYDDQLAKINENVVSRGVSAAAKRAENKEKKSTPSE
jgi:hypothetical protein